MFLLFFYSINKEDNVIKRRGVRKAKTSDRGRWFSVARIFLLNYAT
ncbi:hypothetical protein LTSEURB_5782 [Salmonella enterica subsp. enterica serovar Urbana str. R8-2977]|uniref:Uncharacterized protein n=1 Tax=Salmonella enterica subsp. enterica serovar Urbana str. R8-2977 TaxID=913084 RepID=G5S357_SALET|nr:hypothetical protein LTSEJOH_5521 [Salmonella enterica subsp. enterica serovar Johannesburg str. S5-703]EHC97977.1 hypothetical protein LTSEURB_5782 [Salmonella enterica subsp. enterica serovar Urbana str. R8-2977]